MDAYRDDLRNAFLQIMPCVVARIVSPIMPSAARPSRQARNDWNKFTRRRAFFCRAGRGSDIRAARRAEWAIPFPAPHSIAAPVSILTG
jgi:hypothetical protein